MLFLAFAFGQVSAQAPDWQSAVSSSQTIGNNSFVLSTATDAQGNVYIGGYFNGTISFGSTILTSAGRTDGFVAKWSITSGNFVWAHRMGGQDEDDVSSVTANGTNVYVTGTFRNAASFGNVSLTGIGRRTMFVGKLEDNGATSSFVWVKQGSALDGVEGTSIAVNGASLYVAGAFAGTASFGNINLTNSTSNRLSDIFIAKLLDTGSNGDFVWVQKGGGAGGEFATGLALNGPNLYVSGNFTGNASFGGFNVTSAGSDDVFVAKLIDAGNTSNFTWVQRAGGVNQDQTKAIAVSGPNVYLTGYFQGGAGFGNTNLTSAGRHDVFVAKLVDAGTNGTFTWAQRAGGPETDAANGIAVRGNDVYASGTFLGTASFGNTNLTSATVFSENAFVTKLTDMGTTAAFVWSQKAGSTSGADALSMAISNSGRVYVSGYCGPPASFSPFTIVGTPNSTAFLASIGEAPLATTNSLQAFTFSLYPNPAHSRATLQLPFITSYTPVSITLNNALGQVVRSYSFAYPQAEQRYSLDLRGIDRGVYSIGAQMGSAVAIRRLIVE